MGVPVHLKLDPTSLADLQPLKELSGPFHCFVFSWTNVPHCIAKISVPCSMEDDALLDLRDRKHS